MPNDIHQVVFVEVLLLKYSKFVFLYWPIASLGPVVQWIE